MRYKKAIVVFLSALYMTSGCAESSQSNQELTNDEAINNYKEQIEELELENSSLEEEINSLNEENDTISTQLVEQANEQVGSEEDDDDIIIFEEKLNDVSSVEEVFEACPPILDGAYSEGYGYTLKEYFDSEGVDSFITKLSQTENDYDICDIVTCLSSEINLVYCNVEDYSVDGYIREIHDFINEEDKSTRELQIAYQLLSDLETLNK